MTDFEIGAIVVGLTELAKQVGIRPKYCPFVAIGLGILVSVIDFWRVGNPDYILAVMKGIVIGTTSTGLYAAADGFAHKSSKNGHSAEETF